MNFTFSIFRALFFFFVLFFNFSAGQNRDSVLSQDQISSLKESITEIRRDQLNYKIERDLLKETFSTNYQTVNIVLTIVLGIFTVIGFLGFRDIGTLHRRYNEELERLNDMRRRFERQIDKFVNEQSKVKEEFASILKINEEQNNRIKVLELQEKVITLIKNSNYPRALDYIDAALELDKGNIMLLSNRGTCLWRMNNLAGAISAFNKVVELDPNNFFAIENILELYAISNQKTEYTEFYKRHKPFLNTLDNGVVTTYFDALLAYMENDLKLLHSIVSNFAKVLTAHKVKKLNWDFSDINKAYSLKQSNSKDALLLTLIKMLNGEVNNTDANSLIAKIKING